MPHGTIKNKPTVLVVLFFMPPTARGKNPDALRRRSAAVYRRLRCAACLLSRKDCSVMKKINSTNNAEQPRPPAFNVYVASSAFGDRRELLHECAKPRPPAPNKNKTNLRVNLEFVLFFTRDYFGLRVS